MHLEVIIGYLSRRQNRADDHCQTRSFGNTMPVITQRWGHPWNMPYSGKLLAIIHVLREVCIQRLAWAQSVGSLEVDLVFGADGSTSPEGHRIWGHRI